MRQGTALLSHLILHTWGRFCLLKRTVEVDLKIRAGSSWRWPDLHTIEASSANLHTALRSRHFELQIDFLTFLSFQDKCLRKISSGLYTFQTYLKYIQETFISENQNVESLSYNTEHLAQIIKQMVSWF